MTYEKSVFVCYMVSLSLFQDSVRYVGMVLSTPHFCAAKVLSMLGNVQFELQKLVDSYVSSYFKVTV